MGAGTSLGEDERGGGCGGVKGKRVGVGAELEQEGEQGRVEGILLV